MNGVHVCVCVISCKDRQHVRVKMEEFAGNFINESQIRTISEEKHKKNDATNAMYLVQEKHLYLVEGSIKKYCVVS